MHMIIIWSAVKLTIKRVACKSEVLKVSKSQEGGLELFSYLSNSVLSYLYATKCNSENIE